MRQGTKSIRVLFITLLVCVFPLTGQTLKIETINVAPFGFIGKDGKPTGMMFEISNRIAQEADLKYTNEIIPYARTIFDLKIGTADFVLRFSNDELPAIAVPLVSIITMTTIILSKADAPYASLNDLDKKLVGVVRGGKFDEDFDNKTAINKVQVNDYAQMLKLLMRGRIDACIGTNVGLYYNAKQLGINPEMLSLPMQLSSKEFILHFSRKNADIQTMNKLKESVEKLKVKGEIRQIVNKYMGDFKWDIAELKNQATVLQVRVYSENILAQSHSPNPLIN